MVHDIDVIVVNFFNQFVGRNVTFDKIAVQVTLMNLFRGAFIAALMCWAYFKHDKRIINPSLDWPRIVVGATLAIAISRLMQNHFPMRLRPRQEPALDFVIPDGLPEGRLEDWSSFPSDHAVMFGALALAIFLLDRRLGWLAIIWTIVVILLPRIYLGAHYPSDLVVGAVIGASIMAGIWLLPSPQFLQRGLLDLEDRHKGIVVAALFLFLYFCSTMFADVRVVVERLPGVLDLVL